MENTIASFEEDLIKEWLKNMETNEWQYKEPLLTSKVVGVVKNACNHLQQDIHVFVNSVEILEEYIRGCNSVGHKIEDPILTLASAITISSKYTGDQDLKLKHVQDWLQQRTGKVYTYRDLLLREIEILKTLDNKLALETIVDDLTTLAAKFEHESKIKTTIIPLCLDVLEMMYLMRRVWFFEFRKLYSVNEEALFVFEKLICSRLFVPSAIIIYTLKQTAYKDTLNLNLVITELAGLCKVHIDHLKGLVRKMKHVFQTSG